MIMFNNKCVKSLTMAVLETWSEIVHREEEN